MARASRRLTGPHVARRRRGGPPRRGTPLEQISASGPAPAPLSIAEVDELARGLAAHLSDAFDQVAVDYAELEWKHEAEARLGRRFTPADLKNIAKAVQALRAAEVA